MKFILSSWWLPVLALLLTHCGDPADPATDGNDDSAAVARVDTFALRSFAVRDSVFLFDDEPDGPAGRYGVSSFEVTGGSEAFRRMVNDSLLATTIGMDGPTTGKDYPTLYRRELANYRQAYLSERAGPDERAHAREFSSSAQETNEITVVPILNRGGYLTLEQSYYSYAGGAHGLYGTSMLTFADEPARRVRVGELLNSPVDSTALVELIRGKIDPARLYGPEEDVYLTDNAGLTSEGLRFIYPPYDIGPYAAGEIVVDLSFAELRAAGLTDRRHPVTDR